MSRQLQYLIQAVNTGLVCTWYYVILPAVRMGLSCSWKQLFAAVSTIEVKQKSFKQKTSIIQSAYTSAMEQSPLKWNGCDRDVSMHDTDRFYYYHVTFWNLIVTANILAAEVTVWTRGGCQAILLQPGNEASITCLVRSKVHAILCCGMRYVNKTVELHWMQWKWRRPLMISIPRIGISLVKLSRYLDGSF